jgi:glycosyltransferase involved in cell wall biosynthesis
LMEAFPMVLKKVPNARLIIGGANHHTKVGYWESIRDAQPAGLPIEFRGYIPENEIPELFASTSIVAIPYDSATGSSGPAHQACEFGVPIVCADLTDFRAMVDDEDMAARFYAPGNAADLADQLIAILQSPEIEHEMAEQNFVAGLEMMIGNVVNNYLRWFRLQRCKRTLNNARAGEKPWSSIPISGQTVDHKDHGIAKHSAKAEEQQRPESRMVAMLGDERSTRV